eukprot:360037-Chlamydomonas_euryale.AAC.2
MNEARGTTPRTSHAPVGQWVGDWIERLTEDRAGCRLVCWFVGWLVGWVGGWVSGQLPSEWLIDLVVCWIGRRLGGQDSHLESIKAEARRTAVWCRAPQDVPADGKIAQKAQCTAACADSRHALTVSVPSDPYILLNSWQPAKPVAP